MKKLTFLLILISTMFLISCDKEQPEPNNTPVFTGVVASTDVTTYGGNDGTITVNVENGTPPYDYILDGDVKNTSSNEYYVFKDLTAKTYSVNVIDNNNKSFTKSVTINQPDQTYGDIVVNYNVVHNENDNESGKITINASGGKPPYSYKLNNGTFVSNNVFTNLEGNTYSVTVKDDRGVENTVNDIVVKIGFTFDIVVIHGSLWSLDDGCIKFYPSIPESQYIDYTFSVDGEHWTDTPALCGLQVETYHTAYVRLVGLGTDTIKTKTDIYIDTEYSGYRVGDDYNHDGYVGKVFRVYGGELYIVNMNHLFPLGYPNRYEPKLYRYSYYIFAWLNIVNESGTLQWQNMPFDILIEFLTVAKEDIEGFNVVTHVGEGPHYIYQMRYFSTTKKFPESPGNMYLIAGIDYLTNEVFESEAIFSDINPPHYMLGRHYAIVPNYE